MAIDGRTTFSADERYLLVSVINGNGTLVHASERYALKKGMHFILPVGMGVFELVGNAEFIVSHT
jgi:mannose-6-phosphate isomerase